MNNQQHKKVPLTDGPATNVEYMKLTRDFPFVDGHGHLVTEERRQIVDRRTGYDNLRNDTLNKLALEEQTA